MASMQTVTLARNAMATRFEVVLQGEDATRLRAAGEQALNEIERLEGQLSLYRPSSEIARVNAWAAERPVKLSPPVFQLLRQARQLSRETNGAFDITIAPLARCWGFMGEGGRKPTAAEIEEARAKVGMDHLLLDESDCTARFTVAGAMLDLGAIGKGYAIDRAVEVLREAGVTSALLHGGTSTVYGLGSPAEAGNWKVAIDGPP
jgi:thiamine biosynthesis lipoprotein